MNKSKTLHSGFMAFSWLGMVGTDVCSLVVARLVHKAGKEGAVESNVPVIVHKNCLNHTPHIIIYKLESICIMTRYSLFSYLAKMLIIISKPKGPIPSIPRSGNRL